MSESSVAKIKEVIHDFSEMSLTDFRQALNSLISEIDPLGIQLLVGHLKDYRGNRSVRAAIAAALAELDDEQYLEDFAEVIEYETDVSLCKECIQGLVRMGTKDSHSRLVQLSKEKPNATISTLLRQELEKLNQKEPSNYYFENLKKGEAAARATMAASRVLISIGDSKIVPKILEVIESLDGLGRVESARVVAQLGQASHLETLIPIVKKFITTIEKRMSLVNEMETIQGMGKSDRIAQLCKIGEQWTPETLKPEFNSFVDQLKNGNLTEAKALMDKLLSGVEIGLPFFLNSLHMLFQNQVALVTKFHQEQLTENRVRISRIRQLIGFLGEGMGRMISTPDIDPEIRTQVIVLIQRIMEFKFPDIQKMTLFGIAHFIRPGDTELLKRVGKSTQVDGMMRLLRKVGRRKDSGFIPFFLDMVENHQLVDIQELALQGLADLPGVEVELKRMFEAGTHEALRTGIRVVGSVHAKDFVPKLLGLLEDQSDFVRIEIIRALGKIGDPANLKAIERVLYDARNLELIEACLDAQAEMANDEAIRSLKEFAGKTQNRTKALSALEHLVIYYHRWDFALPPEESEFILKLLTEFVMDKDKDNRQKAYAICSKIITWDLNLFNKLRELLKDATSKVRAQSNWDQREKPFLEKSQKSLNRSYYYLKDALEYQEKIEGMLRRSFQVTGDRWISDVEKIHNAIAANEFPFSPDFYVLLADAVKKNLPEKTSWRELALLFQLAGASREKSLAPILVPWLKTVPKQAYNALVDALNMLEFPMKKIQELNQIKSVLLFEGSGFFRKRLTAFLEGLGLEVTACESVSQVMDCIQTLPPDLVLTEATQTQPGDLISEIVKWKAISPALEIIVQTNLRDPAILKNLDPLKPRGILFKPFALDQLQGMIKG